MARAVRALLALVALLLVGATSTVPPTPTRRVTDDAGVMSAPERDDLEARLAAYEHEHGHQLLVWIGRTSGTATIEELAVEAFAAWKVGRKGLDDGLVVFVLVDDRKVRIEVGYGLEDRVTDLIAAQVIRDVMVPRIVEHDFDGAIRGGVEAIVDSIEGGPNALAPGALHERGPPIEDEEPLGWTSWVMIGVAALAFLILLIKRPQLALFLLWSVLGRGGGRRRGDGLGGFSGGGGRSGGGGATGGW